MPDPVSRTPVMRRDDWRPVAKMTRAAGVPGLWDVEAPDGRFYADLTIGQVHYIAGGQGWRLEVVDGAAR